MYHKPVHIPLDKWQKLTLKEKAFVSLLFSRPRKTQKEIMAKLHLTSHSGFRAIRQRTNKKLNS